VNGGLAQGQLHWRAVDEWAGLGCLGQSELAALGAPDQAVAPAAEAAFAYVDGIGIDEERGAGGAELAHREARAVGSDDELVRQERERLIPGDGALFVAVALDVDLGEAVLALDEEQRPVAIAARNAEIERDLLPLRAVGEAHADALHAVFVVERDVETL